MRVTGVMTCRMNYYLTDDFDNPFDLGGPDAKGYNIIGHKYSFIGLYHRDWTRRFDSGPTNCGCESETSDGH
jgi:hypothetical protein